MNLVKCICKKQTTSEDFDKFIISSHERSKELQEMSAVQNNCSVNKNSRPSFIDKNFSDFQKKINLNRIKELREAKNSLRETLETSPNRLIYF